MKASRNSISRASLTHPAYTPPSGAKMVGSYEIQETLGEGEYAKVRKAFLKTTGEVFAIKILDKKKLVERGMQNHVKTEIGIMKMLNHPNIIRLKEVLASDDSIFIVQELASGGEVFERIVQKGKLTEMEAREYFVGLLGAIDYLHDLGIVHRDLKPENLLLSEQGAVKLCDFGFATLLDGVTPEEIAKQVGSPNYIAPELLTGECMKPGYSLEAVDIYGLGCILFVMCAGFLPFSEENTDLMYRKIMDGVFPIPKFFGNNLKSLVQHLMERDWQRRYSRSQIRSHAFVKYGDVSPSGTLSPSSSQPSLSPIPIPQPQHLQNQRKDSNPRLTRDSNPMSMTFSSFEKVQVISPAKKNSSSASSDATLMVEPPFINCFEFLSDLGVFDLSHMFSSERQRERVLFAFSTQTKAHEILQRICDFLKEEKLNAEMQEAKFRIKADCREVGLIVQLFKVTNKLLLVDFRKMRGSLLVLVKIYRSVQEKAAAAGLVYNYKKVKSCFVSLPQELAKDLIGRGLSRAVIRLSWTDWRSGKEASLVVGWDGSVARDMDSVEFNALLYPQITEGQEVSAVLVAKSPSVAKMVCVEPLTADDWEMLELNAGYLEEQILSQVYVCSVGQVFPLWIFGKQVVKLKVKSISGGNNDCILLPDTDFVVEPKMRKKQTVASATAEEPKPWVSKILASDFNAELKKSFKSTCVAVHPEDAQSLRWRDGLILTVFSSAQQFDVASQDGEDQPQQPQQQQQQQPQQQQKQSVVSYSKLDRITVRIVQDVRVSCGFVYCPSELMASLRVLPMSSLQFIPSHFAPEDSVEGLNMDLVVLNKGAFDPESVSKSFKSLLQADGQAVFCNGSIVKLSVSEDHHALVRIQLPKLDFGKFVLGELLKKLEPKVFFASVASLREILSKTKMLKPSLNKLYGVSKSFTSLRQHLEFCLQPQSFQALIGRLALVMGGAGSGKTSLINATCREIVTKRSVYVETIDCASLVAEKLSRVKAVLRACVARCQFNQPAVFVLESLHLLCPTVDDDDGSGSYRPQQLALVVRSLIRSVSSMVVFVATCPSAETLHGELLDLSVAGVKITIEALSTDSRLQIAKRLTQKYQLQPQGEGVLEKLADLTDGFVCGDIASLLQRVPKNDFTMKALLEAKKATVPSNLQGIKLHSSRVKFADVGGLESVKAAMKQMLEWPTKYAAYFAHSPIKLPTGVLLYGPPGTGKTLVANACASEFGLNFLSVSGPELLSKYIGASEQAVRDVFRRAKACKPCVIVFDEFDSIAPRRGHDSTGVTDRVVNQMLTQLDGVESRVGVYVIGVTSRPDLIDPALLRPGRLDKLLFCPVPDATEREDILRIIAGNMQLEGDAIDWKDLASRTENFTGADLQALMYNAQLNSVHALLDKSSSTSKQKQEDEEKDETLSVEVGGVVTSKGLQEHVNRAQLARLFIDRNTTAKPSAVQPKKTADEPESKQVVTSEHILAALADIRPSIGEADRRKYDGIYGAFRDNHRDADFKTGLDENAPKQTLM